MLLKSKILKNATLNLIGYAYLLVASFISIPMLLRALGTAVFAQYIILAAIPAILSIFDLGISQAVIRAQSLQGVTLKVRQTSYAYFLGNATLLGLLVFLIPKYLGNTLLFTNSSISLSVTLALSGSVFLNMLLTHFLSLAQAAERFDIYNLKTWIVGTGNTIVAGYLAVNGASLGTIFFALFISYLLTLIISIILLGQGQSFFVLPKFDKLTFTSLLNYGLRGFAGRIAGQAELHAAKYIMASTLSASAITIFTIPQSIMYKVAGAITTAALSLFPIASRLSHLEKKDKLIRLYHQAQLFILSLSLFGVILAHTVGSQFLLWWLGDQSLVQAILPVLNLLSWLFVVIASHPLASTIVDALGYPHITSISAVFTATLNIIFLLLLTPRYQAIGAAYAILLASLITTPVFLVITEIVLHRNKVK